MSSNGHVPIVPSPETPRPVTPPESDAATNIVNPNTWRDVINEYVIRAEENKSALSAVLIDIDALKAANDELGHDAGDQLIDMVGHLTSLIPNSLRSKQDPSRQDRMPDVITTRDSNPSALSIPGLELPEPRTARIGGDEFGIILPGADRSGARVVADRLRENVKKELALPENQRLAKIGVGVSIGVATLEPGMKASDLLSLADRAMFVDKLKQLRQLSPEEEASFMAALTHLREAGVRPRDVPKYIQSIGASAIKQAFENQSGS